MLQRLEACGIAQLPKEQSSKLPKSEAIDQQFVTTMDELTPLRTLLDKLYIDFINGLTPACFNQTVSYTSTEGYRIETPLAHYLQHIFNHQTHHRGQLTCVLSQMEMDFGCTDLPMIVPEGYSIDKT